MAVKTTTVAICDRCKRDSTKDPFNWLPMMVSNRQVLLCPTCSNAFTKFLRGAAAKAINAA